MYFPYYLWFINLGSFILMARNCVHNYEFAEKRYVINYALKV
jgi:hypothetical protein